MAVSQLTDELTLIVPLRVIVNDTAFVPELPSVSLALLIDNPCCVGPDQGLPPVSAITARGKDDDARDHHHGH